ncbi:hypothetical protein WN944_011242 [Citrus x changshan-huyou]|uniref:Uncharacterized protein n=1 Tax=Citrus x changshan-huyou TaxID=2935761 RepID=A0AAP0MT24_9ROSI
MMMARFLFSPSNSEAPTGPHGAAAPILKPVSPLVPVHFAFDNDQMAVHVLGAAAAEGHLLRVISEIGLRQDWAQVAEKL